MKNNLTPAVEQLVRMALTEDIGSGDKTTDGLVGPELRGRARVVAKQDLAAAGYAVFEAVFTLLSPGIAISFSKPEGTAVDKGETFIELEGSFAQLLTGERSALNFLQRLSGIATLTRSYVDAIAHTRAVLLDTRKTTPGWRELEKSAVRLGGGTNHRTGLYDGILIKENHISACGGIAAAIKKARYVQGPFLRIEVEVRDLDEFSQALAAGPDIIMLDNMSTADMKKAVELNDGRVCLEASGNVTRDSIAAIAETGVDFISSGAITHSAAAVDISMLIEQVN
ncbi:MAG: carboxylating nicotinate-nucleotide diphosphorylase [Deltaproteobacteria bacterium]|nr:carboxylating nicotinate-nucleotide diphosphorylase [Deltaproteobacteria bacterium]